MDKKAKSASDLANQSDETAENKTKKGNDSEANKDKPAVETEISDDKPAVEDTPVKQPETPKIPLTNEQRKGQQKDEVNNLKAKMLSGEELPTIEANNDKDTKIREDEKHLMHLRVMQKQHDPVAKEYKKQERIVKINKLMFQQMELDRAFNVYDSVDILHDPRSEDEIKSFNELKAKRTKQANPSPAQK